MNNSLQSSRFYLDREWEQTEVQVDDGIPLGLILHHAHSAAALLVFLAGTLVNCTVLLLFHRRPTVRFFSNRFVINMTVAHLLSCLLVTPSVFTTSYAGRWLFGDLWCQVTGTSALVLNLAIVLSLLLIAVDRNYAVSSPLHYSMTVTKRRTCWLIALLWTVSLVSALPPLVLQDVRYEYSSSWNTCTLSWSPGKMSSVLYSVYLSVLGFALPLVMLTFIYCSMFRTARKSSARTGRHRSLSSSVTDTGSSDMRAKTICRSRRAKSTRRSIHQSIFGEEWKAARTGMVILFSFVLCWLPYLTLSVLEACLPGIRLPPFLPSLSILLTLSASVINPYVYVFRNKATRKYVMKLLRCGRRRHYRDQVRTLRSRTLVPVSASSFAPRTYACPDTFFIDRPPMLWRLVTYVDEHSTTIPQGGGPCDLSAEGPARDESVFLTEVVGTPVDCAADDCQADCQAKVAQSQESAPRPSLIEERSRTIERLFLKFRRIHRDSTTSESTDNGFGSFDSVTTDDSRHYDLPPARGFRPPLRRGCSVVEEQELYAGVLTSRPLRRESLGAFQIYRQGSNDTTTTTSSSTSADSQDVVSGLSTRTNSFQKQRPELYRHRASLASSLEVGRRYDDVTTTQVRRNSVCYLEI